MLAMPAAVREWLAAKIERSWSEPGPIVAAIPQELPAGRVQRLAGGGPYGLVFDGRLDEVDGRAAAEQAYSEHNRVAYGHLRERGFLGP
jgi:hypothetical protein